MGEKMIIMTSTNLNVFHKVIPSQSPNFTRADNKIFLFKFRWLTEAIEEESQDKRPLRVKIATWANRVWEQHQDERVKY